MKTQLTVSAAMRMGIERTEFYAENQGGVVRCPQCRRVLQRWNPRYGAATKEIIRDRPCKPCQRVNQKSQIPST